MIVRQQVINLKFEFSNMLDPKDYSECDFSACGNISLPISEGSNPRTYLGYAQADLNDPSSDRTCVNSLSNAKRSLHFQVDILSEAFGIAHSKLGKRLTFPQKLEFCVKCGVIGPRILGKINRMRNAVEHDYYLPTPDESQDFVDVVELFLHGTDSYIKQFPEWLELESPAEKVFHGISRKHIKINFPANQGVIKIYSTEFNDQENILHTEAQKFIELLKNEAETKSQSGVEVLYVNRLGREVLYVDDFERRAYQLAFQSLCENKDFQIKAEEKDDYYKWVSLILSKL